MNNKLASKSNRHLKGGDNVANQEVTVYVDGSCRGQGLPHAKSGWAFVITGDLTEQRMGKIPGNKHDSNRAEAYALLQAMHWIDENPGYIINIRSDSALLLEGIKTKKGRSLNPDIWNELRYLLSKNHKRVRSIKWIPSEENLADGLAKQASVALVILNEEGINVEFDADVSLAE